MSSIAANDGSARRADVSGLSTLTVRIVSALVLAPVVLAAIWFGAPWYTLLVAAAIAVMAWEWARMCCGGAATVEAALMPALALAGVAAATFGLFWTAFGVTLAAAAGVTALAFAMRRDLPFWAGAGSLLVGLAGIALVWLRDAAEAGALATFWLFGAIWLTDTCAYFTGRTIGGPRLAPRVSPNKTWAGLIGGAAAAGVFTAVWPGWIAGQGAARMAVLGVAVAVIAQLSDLTVSRVKRLAHVKDTGALIPGHGGLLDRADGFLLTGALVVLMALFGGKGVLPWQ
jgi:phosphatidate cytidylyltransferase